MSKPPRNTKATNSISRGIALLETTVILIVLVSLIFAGVVTYAFLSVADSAQSLVAREIDGVRVPSVIFNEAGEPEAAAVAEVELLRILESFQVGAESHFRIDSFGARVAMQVFEVDDSSSALSSNPLLDLSRSISAGVHQPGAPSLESALEEARKSFWSDTRAVQRPGIERESVPLRVVFIAVGLKVRMADGFTRVLVGEITEPEVLAVQVRTLVS